MEQYLKMTKALSDRTRVRILGILRKAGKPLCICEIVDSVYLAQYNVSKHIKELKNAGLVSEKRDGKFMFYSITEPKDRFHGHLLDAFRFIDSKETVDDGKRLGKRLGCRVAGKCVIGINKQNGRIK